MHPASLASLAHAAIGGGPGGPDDHDWRTADASTLAAALQASRQDTLAHVARLRAALPGLQVPQRPTLNPPLWELGHIGWFQEFWLARNPQRADGASADPLAPRAAPLRPGADALYDSSAVPHASRWTLPLPDADATLADLAAQLQQTLRLLASAGADDAALYFFRLALAHEDMHHEAGLYMAQALGIAVDDARWQAPRLAGPPAPLSFVAGAWLLGSRGPGFAFDNEQGAHAVDLPATCIDAQAVRWAEFLPFAEAGGYADARLWTAAGNAWRLATGATTPLHLRRIDGAWQQWRHGRWQALDLAEPACHLTAHEAAAWCRWAGRRLPAEAEWERAAVTGGPAFRWGDAWEWTASTFAPFPGFTAHPYRDYSQPWFDGRPVLRGGSFLTQPRMKHPRYRNFFPSHRNDVPAGFRSCAL
ncbi:MAG TPA: selenoneine synthase SenA [Aquabacterium sp.]|nr:selenoneine synthase SenA [Aquabacterium sp.]HQC94559.1 selenoneine synthase SenA [Aquabacterium sp.]